MKREHPFFSFRAFGVKGLGSGDTVGTLLSFGVCVCVFVCVCAAQLAHVSAETCVVIVVLFWISCRGPVTLCFFFFLVFLYCLATEALRRRTAASIEVLSAYKPLHSLFLLSICVRVCDLGSTASTSAGVHNTGQQRKRTITRRDN